jgi:hypothetical protein
MKPNIKKILDNILDYEIELSPDILVMKDFDGYMLYNKYRIKNVNNIYKVTTLHTFTEVNFNRISSAMAWCIYDYRNRVNECRNILNLDSRLGGEIFNIALMKKLINSTKDIELLSLYENKMNESMLLQNYIFKSLKEYVDTAYRWQKNKFESQTTKK